MFLCPVSLVMALQKHDRWWWWSSINPNTNTAISECAEMYPLLAALTISTSTCWKSKCSALYWVNYWVYVILMCYKYELSYWNQYWERKLNQCIATRDLCHSCIAPVSQSPSLTGSLITGPHWPSHLSTYQMYESSSCEPCAYEDGTQVHQLDGIAGETKKLKTIKK